MPIPEFRWIRYTVEEPHLPTLRALTLAAEPIAPDASTILELPDFTNYPTPADKAKVLLNVAAEVEHSLLVQYLYSAYSLHDPVDDPDQTHKMLLSEWRGVLTGIAKEEMGHLLSVQNILILLGLPLTLEREEMPMQKKLYPFPMHLEPLTRRSLAKYVVAESPPEAQGIEDIVQLATGAAGQMVNHVAVLYALIGVVFTKNGELDQNASRGPWYAMVRDIAQYAFKQQAPEAWHLKDENFHSESFNQQAKESDDEWGTHDTAVHVFAMRGRTDALAALSEISIQGEGSGTAGNSHFERFLAAFRGSSSSTPPTPPFPDIGEWQPARNVPTDPRVLKPGDSPGPGDITHATTQNFANLANLRYALLLGYIEHSLLTTGADRSFLIDQCFHEMIAGLRKLSGLLTTMPQREDGTGVAALPFTLPPAEELHLPAGTGDEHARWELHKKRLEEAIQIENNLGLNTEKTADQMTLQTVEQHLML
jgi:hypothetical protein